MDLALKPLEAILFWSAERIVRLGFTRRLRETKLQLPTQQRAGEAHQGFEKIWLKESVRSKPSLIRALLLRFWFPFLAVGIFKVIWGIIATFNAAFFILFIVEFIEDWQDPDEDVESWKGWILATSFFLSSILMSISLQQMWAWNLKLGIKMRGALMTAVYNKAMRLESTGVVVTDIVSLVASDCSRMFPAVSNIHYIWTGAVESMLMFGAVFYFVGLSAFAGLALILITLPVQFGLGLLITRTKNKNIFYTDERVQVIHEILLAIKLIKVYAWESSFAEKVRYLRSKEMRLLFINSQLKSIALAIVFLVPPLIALVIFTIYVLVADEKIKGEPGLTFSVICLLNSLRFPLVVLPKAFRIVAEAWVSVRRIEKFLLRKDEVSAFKGDVQHQVNAVSIRPVTGEDGKVVMKKKVGIKIKDGNFSIKGNTVLKDINLKLRRGMHSILIGPVGSGKTCLLYAILGELQVASGSVKVEGSVAYVPQEPWLQRSTVRENILFGKEFDRLWYNEVVHACALERDFLELEHGDLTELGEGGVNLSGGQKQRIAMARACYSQADIYLLDTPLSAVDQHTLSHIMTYCIKGLLLDRTVILLSHNLQIIDEFDCVGVMKEGQLIYFAPYNDQLLSEHFPSLNIIVGARSKPTAPKPQFHPEDEVWNDEGLEDAEAPADGDADEADKSSRSKKWYTYWSWARASNPILVIIAVAIIVFTQGIRIGGDYWLSLWVKDEFEDWDTYVYVLSYAGWVALFGIFLYIRGTIYFAVVLRGASRMQRNFFSKLPFAPMSYFAVTPLGSLLNAVSKDQDKLDELLPDSLHLFLIYGSIILTTVVLVSSVLPWFTLIACPLLFLSFLIFLYAFGAIQKLRNLVAATNHPIFSHVGETLQGIIVVRAFRAQQRFRVTHLLNIDRNHLALSNLETVGLWLAFRLDLLAALLCGGLAFLVVGERDDVDPSNVGLAISNATQALVFLTLMAREFAEADFQIDAAGRVQKLTSSMPQERQSKKMADLEWPDKGGIKFSHLVAKYSEDGDPVLKDLSFKVKPGMKVGIVGRTGSGKSTLVMCLFRMTELSGGKIEIDGVDISKLNLQSLRGSIAIIPQESAMFKGSLRSNLDPFNEHSDEEIWSALEQAKLKETVEATAGADGLNLEISAQRDNFSLGQKQLMCVARAILTRSKILIMDEATSALDPETDSMIQTVVREVFREWTVLTIAHRLDTVIDYDRILVLQSGELQEYDDVSKLLQNQDGLFYSLALDAGVIGPNAKKYQAHDYDVDASDDERRKQEGKSRKRRRKRRKLSSMELYSYTTDEETGITHPGTDDEHAGSSNYLYNARPADFTPRGSDVEYESDTSESSEDDEAMKELVKEKRKNEKERARQGLLRFSSGGLPGAAGSASDGEQNEAVENQAKGREAKSPSYEPRHKKKKSTDEDGTELQEFINNRRKWSEDEGEPNKRRRGQKAEEKKKPKVKSGSAKKTKEEKEQEDAHEKKRKPQKEQKSKNEKKKKKKKSEKDEESD